MKKIFTIILAFAMVASLCACGKTTKTIGGDVNNLTTSKDTGSSAKTQTAKQGATEDYYFFEYKQTAIYPDQDVKEVVAALGEPSSYFEAPSCAFDGIEKTYTYSGFEISTYIDGDIDRIAAIVLTNDLVGTKEGVFIGEDASKIEKTYSTATETSDRMYKYDKGGKELLFIVEGGKIVSIEYLSITTN